MKRFRNFSPGAQMILLRLQSAVEAANMKLYPLFLQHLV